MAKTTGMHIIVFSTSYKVADFVFIAEKSSLSITVLKFVNLTSNTNSEDYFKFMLHWREEQNLSYTVTY